MVGTIASIFISGLEPIGNVPPAERERTYYVNWRGWVKLPDSNKPVSGILGAIQFGEGTSPADLEFHIVVGDIGDDRKYHKATSSTH
jgi:hypothetical protein